MARMLSEVAAKQPAPQRQLIHDHPAFDPKPRTVLGAVASSQEQPSFVGKYELFSDNLFWSWY